MEALLCSSALSFITFGFCPASCSRKLIRVALCLRILLMENCTIRQKKNPFWRLPKEADSVRYLGEEGPRWAASSTAASEQCWLDREELRLVSAGLERPDELGYQRFACWSLIACEINRTWSSDPHITRALVSRVRQGNLLNVDVDAKKKRTRAQVRGVAEAQPRVNFHWWRHKCLFSLCAVHLYACLFL